MEDAINVYHIIIYLTKFVIKTAKVVWSNNLWKDVQNANLALYLANQIYVNLKLKN